VVRRNAVALVPQVSSPPPTEGEHVGYRGKSFFSAFEVLGINQSLEPSLDIPILIVVIRVEQIIQLCGGDVAIPMHSMEKSQIHISNGE